MLRTGHALMCSGIVSEQPKYPHQPTWPGCERSSLAWKSLKLVMAVMGILTRGMSSVVFFFSFPLLDTRLRTATFLPAVITNTFHSHRLAPFDCWGGCQVAWTTSSELGPRLRTVDVLCVLPALTTVVRRLLEPSNLELAVWKSEISFQPGLPLRRVNLVHRIESFFFSGGNRSRMFFVRAVVARSLSLLTHVASAQPS